MITEEKVLNKLKNEQLIAYYKEFPNLTGLKFKFEELENSRIRAEHSYKDGSDEFVIRLGDKWREVDLAHELMHGKIMFIDKYGIPQRISDLAQLIRDCIEDIIVHEAIVKEFNMEPFTGAYLQKTEELAKGLFRGDKIDDWYWDNKNGCNQPNKAFLYVQVWHFNLLGEKTILKKFLNAFRKTYSSSQELSLADRVIQIYKDNNNFETTVDYDNGLKEILNLFNLPATLIKHFKKVNTGFVRH